MFSLHRKSIRIQDINAKPTTHLNQQRLAASLAPPASMAPSPVPPNWHRIQRYLFGNRGGLFGTLCSLCLHSIYIYILDLFPCTHTTTSKRPSTLDGPGFDAKEFLLSGRRKAPRWSSRPSSWRLRPCRRAGPASGSGPERPPHGPAQRRSVCGAEKRTLPVAHHGTFDSSGGM